MVVVMRVGHFVSGDLNEGAARGALWLHQELLSLGVQSYLFSNYTRGSDIGIPNIIKVTPNFSRRLLIKLQNWLKIFFPRRDSRFYFNTGVGGIDIKEMILLHELDLVHFHWSIGLVSCLKKIDLSVPVIWTLRDMWPFTGGCHYSLDCHRYSEKIGCLNCPALGESAIRVSLADKLLKLKKRNFKKIIAVGISDWITNEAKRSGVFVFGEHKTIYNGIDHQKFYPVTVPRIISADCREKNPTLLVAAQRIDEPYKGFDILCEILNSLAMPVNLIVMGRHGATLRDAVKNENVRLIDVGFIISISKMRAVYSAADLFIAPSIQEAFGKTSVESQMCGTPVVCFGQTGIAETVIHKVTGYVAKFGSTIDFRNGIQYVLTHIQKGDVINSECRDIAIKRFSVSECAIKYHQLYRSVTKSQKEHCN